MVSFPNLGPFGPRSTGDAPRRLLLREEQIAKREQDAQALETDFRSKLEGLDAEVTLRARSGIAAAEAREAATERRAKMREEEAAQREAVFREAETTMAVREVEVAAREAAMGENVIGGADSASVSVVFRTSTW